MTSSLSAASTGTGHVCWGETQACRFLCSPLGTSGVQSECQDDKSARSTQLGPQRGGDRALLALPAGTTSGVSVLPRPLPRYGAVQSSALSEAE